MFRVESTLLVLFIFYSISIGRLYESGQSVVLELDPVEVTVNIDLAF